MEWFQSSSGLSTGCYYKIRHKGYMTGMFQSSSGLSTGCYQAFREAGRLLGVSILIRPFDRMLRVTGSTRNSPLMFQSSSGLSTGCYQQLEGAPAVSGLVSILIRPFDRMLPSLSTISWSAVRRFNPHPAFRPDATAMLGFPA